MALLASDGTIMVAYRVADTGMLAVSRQVEPNGGWEPDPVILFGQAGLGGASGVCAPPGIGEDGVVYRRRQTSPGIGHAFGDRLPLP